MFWVTEVAMVTTALVTAWAAIKSFMLIFFVGILGFVYFGVGSGID